MTDCICPRLVAIWADTELIMSKEKLINHKFTQEPITRSEQLPSLNSFSIFFHHIIFQWYYYSDVGRNPLPWSQRFFLIFLRERDLEEAAKRRQRVAKATRRERKTSGYLGLESHFHADDSCQTRQIANKKGDQWQLSKHVLISRYFFKSGLS